MRRPFLCAILGVLKANANGLDSSLDRRRRLHPDVMVGAHYDAHGRSCPTSDPADTICNGATDNTTGVAALLATSSTSPSSRSRRPRPWP